MSTTAVVTTAALIGLGAAGVGLYLQNRDLSRRLDEVALQAAAVPERAPLPAPEGPVLEGAVASPATQGDLAAMRQTVAALATRVAQQEERAAQAGPAGASGALGAEAFERGVREVLDRVQEEPTFKEKVAQAAGKPALDKKPTFAALSQYLTLDSTQESSFRDDLTDIQGQLFALLAERRPDGRVLLDEIMAAEALPPNDPKRTEVFLDLFKLKIPGVEQTYVERAVALAASFRKKADGYLRQDQRDRFGAVEIDLFGVKMN
jgi:hypothetical protein